MNFIGKWAAILAVLFLGIMPVYGAETTEFDSVAQAVAGYRFEREYGQAKPPPGYVQLCARLPEACKPASAGSSPLRMSAEKWSLIEAINTHVNHSIVSITDKDLYGVTEYWTYPSDAGDCEDYVLLKKRLLEQAGFAKNALLITVVLDENGEGHAVLTVATSNGDFVLDNRRDDIRVWYDTGYTFRKRQSEQDPMRWVSLKPDRQQTPLFTAGGNDK